MSAINTEAVTKFREINPGNAENSAWADEIGLNKKVDWWRNERFVIFKDLGPKAKAKYSDFGLKYQGQLKPQTNTTRST